MGYALIWAEGLAVALLAVALAAAWAARGGRWRWLAVALVGLLFLAPGAVCSSAIGRVLAQTPGPVRTTWLPFVLSWLAAFLVCSALVLRRAARDWPLGRLAAWLGGAALAFGMTFWNLDLAARADLAIARQEMGAFLLSLSPPPAPGEPNAAPLYARAIEELTESIREPWAGAARFGRDADWADPYLAGLVKRHAATLALLRKAAALPVYRFDPPEGPLDVISEARSTPAWPKRGADLLAIDARVEAARGNLREAFDDVAALLGLSRHVTASVAAFWVEDMAWKALEDVLRLAPPDRKPLPDFHAPEAPSMVRLVRREQAFQGALLSAVASQPALLAEYQRENGPWAPAVTDLVVAPLLRVFIVPDELVAMRRLFDDYRKPPRSARDETPEHWAELRRSVAEDPTSLYGLLYVKPRQMRLLTDGGRLAVLRQAARAGLAAAAYQRKHGRYPERWVQLVPDFLPAAPTDPRDGRALGLAARPDGLVVFAPMDAAAVEGGEGSFHQAAAFRLPARP